MTSQNKKDLKLIIDYYGKASQLTMCIEEMSELTKELCKCHRGMYHRNTVIEEVADVLVTLEQVKLMFGFTDSELNHIVDSKIQRTLKRMGEDK